MKVVLLNRYFHPDESATSRVVSSLAFALAAAGHEVTALCGRARRDGGTGPMAGRERVRGVSIVRLATTRFDRGGLAARAIDALAFHASAMWWLATRLRRGDVVVVCTDPPLQSVSAAIPVAARGAVLVNWLLDLYPETAIELGVLRRGGLLARIALAARDLSLRGATRIVCVTASMRAHLIRAGLPENRMAVVSPWSDAAEIVPVAPETNGLRQEWGLRDTFVVGYSGNFGRAHDFATLLDAADELRDDPGIRFLLIGDGARRGWVEAEAARRGLPNLLFRPLQPRDRLSESLGAADVHLVSLLPELEHCIVPSKLYGVLAAGRPVLFVGAPDGEVARTVRSAGCGDTVRVGDGPGLARRIRALRSEPSTRAEMGVRARRLLVEGHGAERGVAAWQALLAGLARPRTVSAEVPHDDRKAA